MSESGRTKTHIVEKGDTLWGLSREHNVSVEKLQEWNGMGESNVVRLGQTLIVERAGQAQEKEIPAKKATELNPDILAKAEALGKGLYIQTESKDNSGVVFLTFDDGPKRGTTDKILDALKDSGHKATFFVQGTSIRGNEDILKRIVAEGHEIGVHSWDHTSYNKQSAKEIQHDLKKTADAIFKETGVFPEFSRPPYGHQSTRAREAVAALGDGGVIGKNDEFGFIPVFWDVDTSDYKKTVSNADMLKNIKTNSESGSIILAHDIKTRTADLVPEILKTLDDMGMKSKVMRESDNLAGKELNPMSAIGGCAKGLEKLANKSPTEIQTASVDDGITRS